MSFIFNTVTIFIIDNISTLCLVTFNPYIEEHFKGVFGILTYMLLAWIWGKLKYLYWLLHCFVSNFFLSKIRPFLLLYTEAYSRALNFLQSPILTGKGANLPLTLTHILGGKLSSCSQLVSNKQKLKQTLDNCKYPYSNHFVHRLIHTNIR